jgi:phage gp46-like protein
MTDITTVWSIPDGRGDWAQAGASLLSGNDLPTAILISLFTDRRAAPDDAIPDGSRDPRGWWGDLGRSVPIGSRLWLLDRSKATTDVLNRAHDYVVEALQWLITDGVVAKFDLTVEWTRPNMLGIRIIAHQPDGKSVPFNYAWAWQGIS